MYDKRVTIVERLPIIDQDTFPFIPVCCGPKQWQIVEPANPSSPDDRRCASLMTAMLMGAASHREWVSLHQELLLTWDYFVAQVIGCAETQGIQLSCADAGLVQIYELHIPSSKERMWQFIYPTPALAEAILHRKIRLLQKALPV